jgi:hypothetical protein
MTQCCRSSTTCRLQMLLVSVQRSVSNKIIMLQPSGEILLSENGQSRRQLNVFPAEFKFDVMDYV